MQIITNIYEGRKKYGDYKWMIKQPEYDDILFIFNDNEECHDTNISGGGNAIIRKYNKYNTNLEKPRSAGIPTGTLSFGGYDELSEYVKMQIDSSIEEIKEIIQIYNYKKICYSINKDNTFGTGIFTVDEDVKNYIVQKIKTLQDFNE
jgi:hypothetical protein